MLRSRDGEDDLHVAAGGVRVGTDLVRLLGQPFGGGPVDARKVDLEPGAEAEAAALKPAEGDVGNDLGVGRVDLLAGRDDLERGVEARRIPRGEELFGVRPAALAAELLRSPDGCDELAVEGLDVAVATITRGNGRSRVERCHALNCIAHNLIVQVGLGYSGVVPRSRRALDLDVQLCFPLYATTRAVTKKYAELLADVGLTYPQYLVMLALWESSPRSLGELAGELAMEPATLSPLVKRLEAQGRVSRTRRVEDERVLDIALSEVGRALRQDALDVPRQIMQRVGMDAGEIAELRAALVRFAGRTTDPVSR